MALTDLLQRMYRLARPLALGLAVYGCGGAEPGSGGKPKGPTYEGMCEDFQTWAMTNTPSCYYRTPEGAYIYCLEEYGDGKELIDKRTCAEIYCYMYTDNCGCSDLPSYNECLVSLGEEPTVCGV